MLSGNQVTALQKAANEIGIPYDWLEKIIRIESNHNPAAKNPNSSATGLIQFISSSAKMVGTSTASLQKMTYEQQLPYVVKYFKHWIKSKGKPGTFLDAYCIVFYPAWVGKPLDAVLSSSAYNGNKPLDLDKDGKITKAEFAKWASKFYNVDFQVTASKVGIVPKSGFKMGTAFWACLGLIVALIFFRGKD